MALCIVEIWVCYPLLQEIQLVQFLGVVAAINGGTKIKLMYPYFLVITLGYGYQINYWL